MGPVQFTAIVVAMVTGAVLIAICALSTKKYENKATSERDR